VDLNSELTTVTNQNVVQRLKLILDKLEGGQLEAISPEVLRKNIHYAVQLIQDGDVEKDRFVRSFKLLPMEFQMNRRNEVWNYAE